MPKLKISPSQALLILIKAYQLEPIPIKTALEQLKSWYLSGFEVDDQLQTKLPKAFQLFISKHPALQKYQVSFDKEVINADASRRFFETQLAFYTLKEKLDSLDIHVLQAHFNALNDSISTILAAPAVNASVAAVFEGDVKRARIGTEYAYLIYLIKHRKSVFKQNFTEVQLDKLKILSLSVFLSLFYTERRHLPIAIYSSKYFTVERGRERKNGSENEDVRNSHLGIMSSYMPLPKDDIAAMRKAPHFFKSTDKATYIAGIEAVERQFSMGHPFICGLSGTLLAVLRNIAHFHKNGEGSALNRDAKTFNHYVRLSISMMLFGMGGHSLYEYFRLFELPEVRSGLKGVVSLESVTLDGLFRADNAEAFDTALQKTIRYNTWILNQKEMHQELIHTVTSAVNPEAASGPSL
jgi:hypothetical protein